MSYLNFKFITVWKQIFQNIETTIKKHQIVIGFRFRFSFCDINYKRAPKSNIPGEITSAYQIDTGPGKISKIEFEIKDIDKLSKESQKYLKEILDKFFSIVFFDLKNFPTFLNKMPLKSEEYL